MTIKRFELVPITGTGGVDEDGNEDPIRPDLPAGQDFYVTLGEVGNRVLIKRLVADGTPMSPTTLADVGPNGLDVNATALNATQKNNIKTFLTNQGVDIAEWDNDGVSNRKQLLMFVLRRALGWNAQDFRRAFTDFDIAT
jgi:hypothetical protein